MTGATLFTGGRVYTGRRYEEALLVDGGRVVAVGDARAVARDVPTGAERYDLAGGLVLPGLVDAHLHVGEMTRERAGVDLRSAGSLAAVTQAVAERAAERSPGVVGRGLDLERLLERRWPSVAELDRACADRPVVLLHASGHAAVANSLARERAGLAPAGPGADPGPLVEEELSGLRAILREALPLRAEAVERTLLELSRFGLTAAGTMNTEADELAVLSEVAERGRLPLRLRAYVPLRTLGEGPPPGPRGASGRFRVVGAKGFLDGAFGPRTAALEAPYADAPDRQGVQRGEDARLRELLATALEEGLAPALHAIGDRAVARGLRLLASVPGGAERGRLEHASLTPPTLLGPLARLRPTLVVQPGFVWSDAWLADRLGRSRARWAYAFRTLADLGVPMAGSSDAPYDPPDPWRGLRAAVGRSDEMGRSANPSPAEALPVAEALALYTAGGAAALGLEESGRLLPDAAADLVVVAGRSLEDAVTLGAAGVRATWVGGRRAVTGDAG